MPARARKDAVWPVESRTALAMIIERDRTALLSSISRRMGERLRRWIDVEDIYQDSVLRAMAALPPARLPNPKAFRSWFLRIASHRIQEVAREQRIRACRELVEIASGERPDEEIRRARGCLDQVAVELLQLRPSQRLSLLLRDHHDLGWEAIAFMIGQPTRPSTRQLHFRARRSLASLLRPRA